ncbi:phosphoribosylglycinamide formyltransferase [Salisediminibacterium selenitireducens]|uniref:Phosphoribosylglycinamide formyltransferase n=1 Tax=Bacillus selenitireducens (strain ATCC 700615 / DSM 15326 / MLS10) TaxID=439292 RepID=D6XYS4_BACIE|nr:phosphoribosylglycinamide formyltransferase [Salisediminibacterium selenitireducens]ADH98232.1 phosphoribosylglycinamide formyltransferase [[Bacillus] selenitireducens MLS10]
MKLAVFASGSGSNFQAFAEAVEEGRLDAEIVLLVCDRPGALVEGRAAAKDIPVFSFDPKAYDGKAAFERAILSELKKKGADFIALAGYMRLIGPVLLGAYPRRIMNIHPSLLPAFPGLDAIGQAFDAGVKLTGVTLHYVDEGMDTGPIIAQEAVRIHESDTRETVQKKVQTIEHSLYPKTLQQLIEKGVNVK